MKTLFTTYYNQAMQIAITLLLVLITLSFPSAGLSDASYYKTLFSGLFKNNFNNQDLKK